MGISSTLFPKETWRPTKVSLKKLFFSIFQYLIIVTINVCCSFIFYKTSRHLLGARLIKRYEYPLISSLPLLLLLFLFSTTSSAIPLLYVGSTLLLSTLSIRTISTHRALYFINNILLDRVEKVT